MTQKKAPFQIYNCIKLSMKADFFLLFRLLAGQQEWPVFFILIIQESLICHKLCSVLSVFDDHDFNKRG